MGRIGWNAAIGLLFASILLRNGLLFTMGLLLALLGGAALLWSRYALVEVHYRRRLGSRRLFHGEVTDLWIEVTNAKPLPLAWLRCEDEIPQDLSLTPDDRLRHFRSGRQLLVNLFSLRWYERVTRHYRITGTRRGAWQLGPARLIAGDIFGFSQQRATVGTTDLVLVYPRLFPLTALGLPAHHPFGDDSAERRIVDDPLRLMGVREYQQGDSFRHIHWKASARRSDLQTKIFEPSAGRHLLIFLNVDTVRNRFDGADPDLREYLISVAASIARWAWERGESVGVYSNGLVRPGQRLRIPPGSRADQALRVLEGLARLRPISLASIERVVGAETASLAYGSTVVVVSAVVDALLALPLVDLQGRGHAVTIVHAGPQPPAHRVPNVPIVHVGDGKALDAHSSLELA